jgi:hypothetical protein
VQKKIQNHFIQKSSRYGPFKAALAALVNIKLENASGFQENGKQFQEAV